MTKALYLLLVSSMLISKSSDATLTVYKDGTALVKQPVAWTIPAGKSYVTWSGLPNGVHKDTPFLNLDVIFYHNDLMITFFLVLITSVHYEESKFR